MSFTFRYSPTLFTPGEAERITGISVALQRDWRRRGLLRPNEDGHARFHFVDLGELLFLKVVAERGIGPQQARAIASLAGGAIAYYALCHDGAFEGDPVPGANPMNAAIGAIRAVATDKVIHRAVPAPLFIWWADGTELWHVSLDRAIGTLAEEDIEKKLGGPVVVVDQHILGGIMLARAGRPLVVVERVELP
jgi:hypothetical protein